MICSCLSYRKSWYDINLKDSIVSEVNLNEIVNKDAYVLLYSRRNLENIIDLEDLYKFEFNFLWKEIMIKGD